MIPPVQFPIPQKTLMTMKFQSSRVLATSEILRHDECDPSGGMENSSNNNPIPSIIRFGPKKFT